MNNHNSANLSSFTISRTETLLKIDWSNKDIPKSLFLTIFVSVFWIVWTPATLFVTCLLLFGDGPKLFFVIWLIFGYIGVFGIPFWWSLRWAGESVAFDEHNYRHQLVGYPNWCQRNWSMKQVTQIYYGFYDEEESLPTLNVIRGRSRDIIAWWANPATTRELFETIKDFLDSQDNSVVIIDDVSRNA